VASRLGFAGVINPFRGIAGVPGVDDVAVVQMKIESVLGWLMSCGGGLQLSSGDNLALILQYLSPALMDGWHRRPCRGFPIRAPGCGDRR